MPTLTEQSIYQAREHASIPVTDLDAAVALAESRRLLTLDMLAYVASRCNGELDGLSYDEQRTLCDLLEPFIK